MHQFQFWLREALDNIWRNRLMSLLAISTVTIALFILGAFFLSVSNLRAAVAAQTRKLDLVVVLDKDIAPGRRKQIFKAARMKQVKKLDIVMASQVLEKYGREFKMPVDELKQANPLGDELHVQLRNPDDFFAVRNYLAKIKGVESVQDSDSNKAASKLLEINRYLGIGALVSLAILSAAILLIIHNAIRLTLLARRREIRIMQLVGATNGFIRVPFLLEGLFYGLAGAALAAVCLATIYGVTSANASQLMRELMPLAPAAITGICAAWLLLAGAAFGVLGAWLSFQSGSGERIKAEG